MFGFGSLSSEGDNDRFIKNIIIRSGSIKGNNVGVGGIVTSFFGKISNCINYATIAGNYVGGIVGAGREIINCKNYGAINGTDNSGGIAYSISGKIDNCHNYAEIKVVFSTAYEKSAGGILATSGGYPVEISNCSNTGAIIASGSTSYNVALGGIAGQATQCNKCFNTANITSTIFFGNGGQAIIGGVVGRFLQSAATEKEVKFCYNKGNLTGAGYIGGILGFIDGQAISAISIEASYNTGNIKNTASSGYSSGGILGLILIFNDLTLKNCYNTGEIIGGTNSLNGGLIGQYWGSNQMAPQDVSSCYWKDINGDSAQYGIGGFFQGSGYQPSNTGCTIFSATTWPSSTNGWLVGDGSNNAYWKSLGSWNSGNPVYPKLFFEE